MGNLSKSVNRLLWALFFGAGFYIVFAGSRRFVNDSPGQLLRQASEAAQRAVSQEAARCLYPGLFLESGEEKELSVQEWYIEWALAMHPLRRLEYGARQMDRLESAATYEMLVSGGVHDENEVDEAGDEYDLSELAQEENEKAVMLEQEQADAAIPQETAEISEPVTAGTIYNLEELSDFEFLMDHFYTVETNTSISAADLNAEALLSKDMTIDRNVDGPQILIYHTHSQEGFVDSVPGDNSTTIVGAGEYLAELLREKGFDVLHVTSVYDLIDGKLDRSEAYSRAEKEISAILAENPSIQAVIDLHRDGVDESTRLVTEIDGKPTARFMFFNGLSRTKKNGNIDYLYNPYIQDNLALTLQLKLQCEQYYPGLSRNIYLKSLRYNLHLSDKALLIEVGAQTNTVQEILNTMEPLSTLLAKVFGV
ncbi:MAG: stage II sporulation protein P [Eubacteriales bacterium]|nr:stage II sporulation protein P [Eubacteriales bacterium]